MISMLSDKRKDSRANAAEWLSERGVVDAIGPIQAALAKKKDEAVRTAFLLALSHLGADMSAFLGPEAMAKAAEATLKKAKLAPLDWLLASGLPTLRYRDGAPVPEDVLKAWLATAMQQKQPGWNVLLDLYLDQLAPDDAEKLANHIFDAWIAYDSEPTSHEAALAAATEQAQQMYAFYQSLRPPRTMQQLIEGYFPEHKRKYPNSGAATKGILALAKRADPTHVATTARAYLKNHGKRVAQATALVDLAAAIDTPETLQVLVAAATRLRQKTVQAHAGALVEAAAQARGWTADELADRTVPTAGLDDAGVLELPCGVEGRIYRARLADDLTLILENPDGKPVKALPAGDDDQTKESKKTLTAARKELKQIARLQAERLYEALCAEHSSAMADWLADFRGHPVMGRLSERAIWLGLDEDGTVQASFRPTAEGEFTNAEDDPVDPAAFARIRLAHAANLTPETVAAWKQHLKDYEVEPLFAQLDRPFLTVADLPEGATRIDDREGWLTDAKKIQGAGAKLGFTPGPVEDSGWFDHYRKPFKGANLIAVIKISGASLPVQAGASAVLHLEFCPPTRHDGLGQPVPLADVPPILLSECWNDYRKIAATGAYDPDWGKKIQW
ncbi:MAG: DUF4132 domain-containing protein [Rhodobacteraceae bacterium]|nr:DUF4132 domain-containing protein [Paracoccaceae bacterium]